MIPKNSPQNAPRDPLQAISSPKGMSDIPHALKIAPSASQRQKIAETSPLAAIPDAILDLDIFLAFDYSQAKVTTSYV